MKSLKKKGGHPTRSGTNWGSEQFPRKQNVNLGDCDPFLSVGTFNITVPYSFSESGLLTKKKNPPNLFIEPNFLFSFFPKLVIFVKI